VDPFLAPATFFGLFSFVMVIIVIAFVRGVAGRQTDMSNALDKVVTTLALMQDKLVASEQRAMTYLPQFQTMVTKVDLIESKLLDVVIMLAKQASKVESLTSAPSAAVIIPPPVEVKSLDPNRPS